MKESILFLDGYFKKLLLLEQNPKDNMLLLLTKLLIYPLREIFGSPS